LAREEEGMATRSLTRITDVFRKAVLLYQGDGCETDGQLLEQYRRDHDQVAFEALLQRHGPMVLGVCRRVLEDCTDAEDAFQTTFLVFVRKVWSIKPAEMVAPWLHGVARLTAMKLRAHNNKRRQRERHVREMPELADVQANSRTELYTVLDVELGCLPQKYRGPIILCDLECKTRKQAARQLGCPVGTLSSRLARARVLLARRLVRRGLSITGGTLAVALARSAAGAGVPAELIRRTLKAIWFAAGSALPGGIVSAKVTALTRAVLLSLSFAQAKPVGLCLLIAALVLSGAGLWACDSLIGFVGTQAARASSHPRAPGLAAAGPEAKTNQLAVTAKGDRVFLRGSLSRGKEFVAEGNRAIIYQEGTTRALALDGTLREPVWLQSWENGALEVAHGPQMWHISSGPVQLKKSSDATSGPGVVKLQDGLHQISARGTAGPENACQFEFSAQGDRLVLSAIIRGRKLQAEADRVLVSEDRKELQLESAGTSTLKVLEQSQPNGCTELRGQAIRYSFEDHHAR
jgi:RNA polymerase sigma factor (sigma-70 family)